MSRGTLAFNDSPRKGPDKRVKQAWKAFLLSIDPMIVSNCNSSGYGHYPGNLLRMALCIVFFGIGAGCATSPGPSQTAELDGDTEEYVVESYCSPAVSPQVDGRKAAFPVQPGVQAGQERTEELLFLSPRTRQIAQVNRPDAQQRAQPRHY